MLRKSAAALLLAALGIFLSILHYILPIQESPSEATAKLFCPGIYVHPEPLVGALIFISAMGALFSTPRARWFFLSAMLLSLAGIVLGLETKPLSYYLGRQGFEVGFDTVSFNSHYLIGEFIIIISSISFIASIFGIKFIKNLKYPKISFFIFAISNLVKKRFRALAIGFFLTLMVGSLFSSSVLWLGVNRGIEESITKLGADIVAVPEGTEDAFSSEFKEGEFYPAYMESRVEGDIRQNPGVKRTEPQISLELRIVDMLYILKMQKEEFKEVDAIGISERDTIVTPWIYRSIEKEGLTVGWYVKYPLGTNISLREEKSYPVVALLENTGIPYIDKNIFLSLETAHSLIGETQLAENMEAPISAVFVWVSEDSSVEEVAESIEESNEVDAVVLRELASISREELEGVFSFLFLIISLLWLMGIIMIGLLFMLIINERKREISILRAMGAGKSYIVKEITLEGLYLGIAGGFSGIMLGSIFLIVFNYYLAETLLTSFNWISSQEMIILGGGIFFLGLLIPVLASLYPVWKTVKREPYQFLKG